MATVLQENLTKEEVFLTIMEINGSNKKLLVYLVLANVKML